MENTQRINHNQVTIPGGATFIEKVHSCANCPIRRLAAKHPQSVFARLHAWHKSWWPGWKANQARVCACSAGAGSQRG